jgi:hypothetical protein
MHLRRILLALLLGLVALTLFSACAAPGPAPPPQPPPMVEPPPPPPPPLYFVNVSSLALREGPTTSAPMISTLHFNDEVELMGDSDGWGRVRDIRRGLVGWAYMKYLQPAPADRPRYVPPKRNAAPAAPKEEPKEEPKPTPVPKAM